MLRWISGLLARLGITAPAGVPVPEEERVETWTPEGSNKLHWVKIRGGTARYTVLVEPSTPFEAAAAQSMAFTLTEDGAEELGVRTSHRDFVTATGKRGFQNTVRYPDGSFYVFTFRPKK